MSNFEIHLSPEDVDRLFAVKKLQGKDDMTGGDFAGKLLSRELYHLFPGRPEVDEMGHITNAELYTGKRADSAERMAEGVADSPEEAHAVAAELEKELDAEGEIILPNGMKETAAFMSSIIRDTLRPVVGGSENEPGES